MMMMMINDSSYPFGEKQPGRRKGRGETPQAATINKQTLNAMLFSIHPWSKH